MSDRFLLHSGAGCNVQCDRSQLHRSSGPLEEFRRLEEKGSQERSPPYFASPPFSFPLLESRLRRSYTDCLTSEINILLGILFSSGCPNHIYGLWVFTLVTLLTLRGPQISGFCTYYYAHWVLENLFLFSC